MLHWSNGLWTLHSVPVKQFWLRWWLGEVKARVRTVQILYKTLGDLQWQLWSVENVLDVQQIGDVPDVLGERTRGKSVVLHKRCCEVRQSPLLGSH